MMRTVGTMRCHASVSAENERILVSVYEDGVSAFCSLSYGDALELAEALNDVVKSEGRARAG